MQFDNRLLLVFGAIALTAYFAGSGNLSFQEAKLEADKTQTSLNADQSSSLASSLRRFEQEAIAFCVNAVGTSAVDFAVVAELKADGYVRRSWRRGDSKFAVCFQKGLQENFVFKPYFQPFFISIEHLADLQ